MIFTTKMKHVFAVVLRQDSEQVTKQMIDQGLLHFMKINELKSSWHDKVGDVIPSISKPRIGELKKRIESFLSITGKSVITGRTLNIRNFKPLDLDKAEKFLDDISDKIQGYRDRQKNLQQEILKLRDIQRQVDFFGNIREGIKAHSSYSFLSMQTGSVPVSKTEELSVSLRELPSVVLPFNEKDERTHMLVITMKKDDLRVNHILQKYDWQDVEIDEQVTGVKEDVVNNLDAKCAVLEKEQESLKQKSNEIIEENMEDLEKLWKNCRLNELYISVTMFFSKTTRTILFSGWLPEVKQKVFEQGIKKVTKGRCYFEWSSPVEMEKEKFARRDVPVQLNTPKILSPFKMLVLNYSVPEYGSIDPTPLVAVAYLCMFGLMFGDVGQGLILAIAGAIGFWFYKNKNKDLYNLSFLIIWCGVSAVIFGILFGSYFGMQFFKPVWFDYHGIVAGHRSGTGIVTNIFGILAITVYFGIAVISVGLVLNFINLILKRQWLKLLTDKGGILGGWMYFGGVWIVWMWVNSGFNEFADPFVIFMATGLPAVLFLIKPPLEYIIHKKKDPSLKFTPMVPFNLIMEWFVEMIEIIGGYLSNTLSFMRIAGFGIAHVSLMIAFFVMADLAGPVGAVPILLIGNALVIFLEGLSAGIQSLRLNYYEFFSKYFTGAGKAYAPISLRTDNG